MSDAPITMGASRIAWRIAGAAAFVGALSWLPLGELPQPAFAALAAFASSPAVVPGAALADDAAALLPDDLWAVVEGRHLGAIADGWLGGPLHQRMVTSDAWRTFARTPEYTKLLAGLGFAELVSGMKPAALAAALLGDELAAGLVPDGAQPGLVAVLRTTDADVADHLVQVARSLAASKQPQQPVRTVTVRGVEATVVAERLWLAVLDRRILIASSEPLLTQLVEKASGPAMPRAPALVTRLRERESGEPLVRFAFDAKKIGATRPGGRLAPERADNFVGAMLAADLLELASRTDVICGRIDAHGDELAVALDVPGDPASLPAQFRSFGHARAQEPLPVLAPEGTLLSWSLRRDWARFWEDRAQLCDPQTEKDFANMKGGLSLFFGGRSLPDDVLPQLDDEILFVLARQTYPGIAHPPAVRFPAGAFVYRVRGGDAEKLGREFAIGVHSFVAFMNIDRAQHNQTPLLPFVEPFEGVTVWGGRCLEDDDRPADPGRFNLSPASCWIGDRIILSSSEELLHALVHELKQPGVESAGPSGRAPAGCTTFLHVEGPALHDLLLDDREALVTNATVNDGKPEAQAQFEISLLCELAGQLDHATLQSRDRQDGMRVELEIALAPLAAQASTTPAAEPPAGAATAPAGGAR